MKQLQLLYNHVLYYINRYDIQWYTGTLLVYIHTPWSSTTFRVFTTGDSSCSAGLCLLTASEKLRFLAVPMSFKWNEVSHATLGAPDALQIPATSAGAVDTPASRGFRFPPVEMVGEDILSCISCEVFFVGNRLIIMGGNYCYTNNIINRNNL